MEVDFDDARAALIETDRAAETRLPVAVIQTARQRLTMIRAAPDGRALRNWKSLGFRAAAGKDSPGSAVRINDRWSICLRLDNIDSPTKVTVTGLQEQR
jgi:proteic killer suppression protein